MSSYKSFVINGRSSGAFVSNIHLGRCEDGTSPFSFCKKCAYAPANDRCKNAPWVGTTVHNGLVHSCSTIDNDHCSIIWYLGKALSPDEIAEYEQRKRAFDQAAEDMFAARAKARKSMNKWKMSDAVRQHVR